MDYEECEDDANKKLQDYIRQRNEMYDIMAARLMNSNVYYDNYQDEDDEDTHSNCSYKLESNYSDSVEDIENEEENKDENKDENEEENDDENEDEDENEEENEDENDDENKEENDKDEMDDVNLNGSVYGEVSNVVVKTTEISETQELVDMLNSQIIDNSDVILTMERIKLYENMARMLMQFRR